MYPEKLKACIKTAAHFSIENLTKFYNEWLGLISNNKRRNTGIDTKYSVDHNHGRTFRPITTLQEPFW